MREIKFRVWDKIAYDMIYWLEIEDMDCADLYEIFFPSGETSSVVMQYTGLKDKNGKEIYEGDILKFDKIKRIGVVKYDEEFAEFFIDMDKNGEQHMSFIFAIEGGFGFEVIGNIYENPELLKEVE